MTWGDITSAIAMFAATVLPMAVAIAFAITLGICIAELATRIFS